MLHMTFGMHAIPIFNLYVALEKKVSDGYRRSSIFLNLMHMFLKLIFTAFISVVEGG